VSALTDTIPPNGLLGFLFHSACCQTNLGVHHQTHAPKLFFDPFCISLHSETETRYAKICSRSENSAAPTAKQIRPKARRRMVGRTQSTHASRYGRIDDALSILRRAGLLCLARPFVHPCTRLAPASQAREPTRLPYRNVPEFRCHSATHPGGPLLWVRQHPATLHHPWVRCGQPPHPCGVVRSVRRDI
jgi:hypothetical protein